MTDRIRYFPVVQKQYFTNILHPRQCGKDSCHPPLKQQLPTISFQTVKQLDAIYCIIHHYKYYNSITIVKISRWQLLLAKTAISCVLAVFLGEGRALKQYLVLEFGLNLNQGCSGVGTTFPHLFLQHYICGIQICLLGQFHESTG